MNKAWSGILVLAAAGCVSLPVGWPGSNSSARPAQEMTKTPSQPITPEQVNASNAHQKAQELSQELDREAAAAAAVPEKAPVSPTKKP